MRFFSLVFFFVEGGREERKAKEKERKVKREYVDEIFFWLGGDICKFETEVWFWIAG